MARLTWANIKTEATSELRERTDISTRVENWIRQSFLEVAYGYRFHELETSDTFTVSNDTEITFTEAGITNIKHILSLRDVTNKRKVNPAPFRYIDNIATRIGAPSRYCRFGSTIMFDSSITTEISFRLRYRKSVTEPVYSGTTYPDTPDEWDEVILLLAVARGFEALFEPNMANTFEQRAMRLIAKIPTDEFVEAEDDNFGITPKIG